MTQHHAGRAVALAAALAIAACETPPSKQDVGAVSGAVIGGVVGSTIGGGTGRTVAMGGRSLFAFREGLVCREYDRFSLWRWSAQALGPAGAALGWLGPFRWAVRQRATRRLEGFAARGAP